MRYYLAVAASFAWALWLGGLMTLFLLITTLFKAFTDRREIFNEIGSTVFRQFERYQLVLAGVALLLSALSAILTGSTRNKIVVLVLFILATGWAIIESVLFRPQLDDLLKARMTADPAFARIHGYSMLSYGIESLLLVLAGVMLLKEVRDAGASARLSSGEGARRD